MNVTHYLITTTSYNTPSCEAPMPVSIRPDRRFPVWPLGVLLVLLTPSPAAAVSEYQGEVVRVMDGDTIEVRHNQRPERIRLSGIDCPEKGQAYGNNAKHAARPPWLSCTEPGSNVCPIGRGL